MSGNDDTGQKKEIVRCAWCGTAESEDWFRPQGVREFYCTWGCYNAISNPESVETRRVFSCILGPLLSVAVAAYFVNVFQTQMPVTLLIWILSFLIVPVVFYKLNMYNVERAVLHRKRTPAGSRRKEYVDSIEYQEVVVVAAAITCPVCDADIDPASTVSNDTFHCEFCGANVKLPTWVK